MITYEQYMSGKSSHHDYYKQFVTERTKGIVEDWIGIERIRNSTDKHLNDIPLKEWNRLPVMINYEVMRKTGMTNANTLSNKVCIAKAAARELALPPKEQQK